MHVMIKTVALCAALSAASCVTPARAQKIASEASIVKAEVGASSGGLFPPLKEAVAGNVKVVGKPEEHLRGNYDRSYSYGQKHRNDESYGKHYSDGRRKDKKDYLHSYGKEYDYDYDQGIDHSKDKKDHAYSYSYGKVMDHHGKKDYDYGYDKDYDYANYAYGKTKDYSYGYGYDHGVNNGGGFDYNAGYGGYEGYGKEKRDGHADKKKYEYDASYYGHGHPGKQTHLRKQHD